MKQHLRKLSALLLTLVLAISLAPAALAAPTPVANTDITFKGVKAGDTVTAYRMVEYKNDYSSFEYHPAFKTFLEGKKGATSESLDDWFSKLPSADLKDYLTEYTEALQANTEGYDLPTASKVAGTVAAGEDFTKLINLAPGFYLVLTRTTTANSLVYTPVAVFVRVMGDHSVKVYAGGTELTTKPYTITMKSEAAPVIVKKVRNNTSDLVSSIHYQPTTSSGVGTYYGVDFVIQVRIPNYAGDPHFSTLTIKDTLENAALTTNDFSTVSIHRGYDPGTGAFTGKNLNTALKTATSNIGAYTGGKQEIVLDLDYDLLKDTTTGLTETVFYIQYHARLQKDAIDTDTTLDAAAGTTTNMGKNTAALTYQLATDPTEKVTDPVSTSVYTYSVKLEKKDMDGNALAGAKFRLYSDDNMKTEVKLAKDAAGFYYPADVTATGVEIDTDTGSSFLIKGLEQGTYYLKETATKAGYYLPEGVFEIVLTGDGNGTSPRILTGKLDAASTFTAVNTADHPLVGTVSVDGTAVNQLDIVLKNSSQPILPSTGGMGTALFTFGGVALMVLAAGLTIYMRKRKEN